MGMDDGPKTVAQTIGDIPQLNQEQVVALETAGITTLKELSDTPPADIKRITGVSGMDAIIIKEKATRSIEAGVEGGLKGKAASMVSKVSPRLMMRARMKAASMLRRQFTNR